MATNPPYVVKKATAKETTLRCPYAGVYFSVGDTLAVCGACKTAHLEESWKENRGCTAYGCQNAPDFRKDESTLQVNLGETQNDNGGLELSGLDAPRTGQNGGSGDDYELNELVPTQMPAPSRGTGQGSGQRPQQAAQAARVEPEQPNNIGLEYVALSLGAVSILGCFCFGVPSILLGASAGVCWVVSLAPQNRERMFGLMGKVGMAGLICGLIGMLLGAFAVGFFIAAAAAGK